MIVESWVFWSLLAAFMQAVRTAGQKALTSDVSPLGATLVRFLFGIPFIAVYLGWLLVDRDFPELNTRFLLFGVLAGFLQVIATILLIRLFALRNFAVGSCYIKTEVLITAVIGLVLFSEIVSTFGWLAMTVSVIGLVLITIAKTGKVSDLWDISALYGVGAGIAFSFASQLIRQASLSFGSDDFLFTAALTLGYMVIVQTLICLAMMVRQDMGELRIIARRWRICTFVGLTSVLGSVGWFTAFTLERAAYVKTLGQIEFLLTLVISVFFFKEIPNRLEMTGMVVLIGGIVLLLVAG